MTSNESDLPPDIYEAVHRVARETARAEVRAALDAMNFQTISDVDRDRLNRVAEGYVVPSAIAGVPV